MTSNKTERTGFYISEEATKYSVLPQEEFNALHEKWREEGCEESYDMMVKHNLKLILATIKRKVRIRDNIEKEDLFQAGLIGLMRAIELFEPEQGWQFSTYATNWIRQHACREQENTQTTIRVPVHIQREINQYFKALRELPNDANGPQEIYDWLMENHDGILHKKVSPKRIEKMLAEYELRKSDSLEGLSEKRSQRFNGEVVDYIDVISKAADPLQAEGEEILADDNVKTLLKKMLGEESFSKRDVQILCHRFSLFDHEFMTLDEIGKMLGLTRERVRQIETTMKKKLKRRLVHENVFETEDLIELS